MRRFFSWTLFTVTVLVAAAAGFGAYRLATYSWNAIVDYQSPYAELALAPATSGSAIASTTVIVIVDGLSDDASRRMEGLNRLRQYGTDLTLTVPQPSLSYPNWTTILSGAPPYVSGVSTNWFDGRVPVETLIDTALRSNASLVVVGPEDFSALYGAGRATTEFLKSYPATYYASTELVDQAVRLISQTRPRLAVVHLPDVDNAGHHYGGGSPEYAEVVRKTDVDIARLVEGVQGANTAFVIVADHGHIAAGGHGGWEPSVVHVPGVFFGKGMPLGQGDAHQEDVAPTVAVIAGLPAPRYARGEAIQAVVGNAGNERLLPSWHQRMVFANAYSSLVREPTGVHAETLSGDGTHGSEITGTMDRADATRLAFDRRERLWWGLGGAGAAFMILFAFAALSWRAFAAALAGCVAYFTLYNGLYFGLHGYSWSLSAFNEETLVQAFFNMRMLEALAAGLMASAVAGFVYPYLRRRPKGPSGAYRAGWLSLGPATVLVVLATIGIQVAWFVWAWGVKPTWILPDLRVGFKYDLDLIQATALGAAVFLAPVVTYLVGRYHPRVLRLAREETRAVSSASTPTEPLFSVKAVSSAEE